MSKVAAVNLEHHSHTTTFCTSSQTADPAIRARIDVSTVVIMEVTVFWHMMQRILVNVYWRFREIGSDWRPCGTSIHIYQTTRRHILEDGYLLTKDIAKLYSRLHVCQISGCHRGVARHSGVLRCDAISDEWFRRFESVRQSKSFFLLCVTCDDGGTEFLRNVRNRSTQDIASHPGRYESSDYVDVNVICVELF